MVGVMKEKDDYDNIIINLLNRSNFKANLDLRDNEGIQLQHFNTNLEITKLLITKNLISDINSLDYTGKSVLMYNILDLDVESMKFLLKNKKVDVNLNDFEGITPLVLLVKIYENQKEISNRYNELNEIDAELAMDMVKELLKRGDLDVNHSNNETAFCNLQFNGI